MTGRRKHRDSFQHGDNIDLIDLITRIALIDAITTITTIGTIEVVDLISEITKITTIETISSMPDTTPRGSEGVAFRQIITPAGAWASPTGSEDPDSVWDDEAKAYDDDTDTNAFTTAPVNAWSSFLILTLDAAAITSNKIRFYAYRVPALPGISGIDVDVYKDGVWTHVYQGDYEDRVWVEKAFTQGSVTKARVRFQNSHWIAVVARLYEFDFWELTITGGEAITLVEGQYLATAPTLADEDLHYLRLTSSGELIVYIEHVERTPHYVALPTGVNTAVWTPAEGKSIHVTSILVSAEGAGGVDLFHDATLFMKMHFNEKKAVPVGIGGDLTFDADVVLKATWTADVGDDAAYITAVGHEHV